MSQLYIHQPKISVIIPICNVEPYLKECLDSVTNQTLEDIEIICVDDASQDSSANILRSYEAKDSRIKAIYHKMNLSTSQARKDGVMQSTGKYIMFLDGDDSYTSNACEIAYNAIEFYGTDVIQFDTEIQNYGNVPEYRIESNKKLLAPLLDRVERENLVLACWEDRTIQFTLWNKIYNGNLARKGFSYIKDGSFPKAQDLYAFFVIAYNMNSYMGIPDKLYNYKFGTGVTGQNSMTLAQFDVLLTERDVWLALKRFISEQHMSDRYYDIVESIRKGFLNECVNKWMNNIPPEYEETAFEHLIDKWGYRCVIESWASTNYYNRIKVSEELLGLSLFTGKIDREPKTIAYYYRSIKNGGAQRVAAMLCNIFASLKAPDSSYKYNVVLVTDEEYKEDESENTLSDEYEYCLDSRIVRTYLPPYEKSQKEEYMPRFDAWDKIINENNIDVVINGMWCAPCATWDYISIKGNKRKPLYITHVHSFTCVPYSFVGGDAKELMYRYRLSDGVVTMSECDTRLVAVFNKHARSIVNPIAMDIHQMNETNEFDAPTILWVGRISYEKQPMHAVHMMKRVVEQIPNAKLIIVGSGSETLTDEINRQIDLYGLEKNIVMAGYTLDVEKYYRQASVYVSTSKYEGFPLTHLEALSYGIPTVIYDMPWLTLARDGRGLTRVKQGRYDLLAKEVIRLLSDKELYKIQGHAGYQLANEIAAIDVGREWVDLIDDIWQGRNEVSYEGSYEDILFEYLTIFAENGKQRAKAESENKLKKTYIEKSEINAKLQQTYKEKSEINAKLQQTYAEKSEINAKLQQTYKEKSEINAKLQQTYAEKSEINAKLKQAYADKSERGVTIKELKATIAKLRSDIRTRDAKIKELTGKIEGRRG